MKNTKKLLALILSIVMIFSVMTTVIVTSAESGNYFFDADSSAAADQINNVRSATATIEEYNGRKAVKFVRTGKADGGGYCISADYANLVKGAVGIRFWMAGDPTTFTSDRKVSIAFHTSTVGYKIIGEHKGNWTPTVEGDIYEWRFDSTDRVYNCPNLNRIDAYGGYKGLANEKFTEEFLSDLQNITFGVDTSSSGGYQTIFYIDDVEFIYPEGVEPTVPSESEEPSEEPTTTTTTTTTAPIATYFTPADVANKDNWIKGWWDSSNGKYNPTYQNNSRACVKNHIEVTEGETYKFTITGSNASGLNIVVRNYDSTGAFKSTIILTDLEYTVPAGTKYAGVTIYDKSNVIDYINNGTVAVTMAVKGAVEPTQSSSSTTTTTTQPTSSTQKPPVEAGVIYVNANAQTDAEAATYKTLAEAFSAATAGDASNPGTTIKFLSDVKTTSISTLSKNYVTVDLNGYTFQTSSQGISVAGKFCTIKNGKMKMDTTDGNNAAYLINNANDNYTLYVRDIDFSYENFGETTGVGRPAGLIRKSAVGNNTTNVYNCTFKSYVSKRKGSASYLALISYMNGTVNMYNCELDGGSNISAFTVRSSTINLYDTKILNCAYLTSKSTSLAISGSTNVTFYSGSAKYIYTLCTDPEYTNIKTASNVMFTAKENGTESINLSDLTSPYTFFATCAHKFTDGVCDYCYAKAPNANKVAVEVENGASLRLGEVNGIRFYVTTDIAKIKELQSQGATVEVGTLIAPVDLIKAESEFVLGSKKVAKVPYNVEFLGTLNENGYTASIVNIKESNTGFDATYGNIARPMMARGYVKVTVDGESFISYSDYSEVLSRSLGQIAKRFQEDEDAYNELAGTDISTWTKVGDWAAIYDAQNLDSTIRYDYISLSVKDDNGSNFTETAVLGLPSDYDENGEPLRLIVDCHGFAGGSASFKTKYTWLQYFVHQGYAVVVVDGGGTIGAYNMGCPQAIDGFVATYEHILKNYNIKTDGVFVKGNSMGGLTSENLVCSGRIPVIAHINECPVTDLYRQAYCSGWDAGNIKRIASFYGFSFEKYNADHGTNYDLSTFPWTNKSQTVSDAERELYINNFVDYIVPNNPIWKYMSCFDYETKTFKPGYEDFLTATDEDRIAELWSTVTVDYPAPLAIYHGTGDAAVAYKYSEYLANAINKSENSVCELNTYNTTAHGGFGAKTEYICKDGAVMNINASYDDMLKFMQKYDK